MAAFTVSGPFQIPVSQLGSGKLITGAGNFWNKARSHLDGIGCYVFAIQAGKGYTPWYVGKTKTTFNNECFTAHKLLKYNQAILSVKKGTPVLFFISHPKQKGPINHKQIREIEVFFTQVALLKNGSLLNIKNTKQQTWSIQGIVRGTQGNVSKSTADLRKALGLK